MSEIIPLTIEHLRIIREDISTLRAEVKVGFEDMRKRLGRVEQSILGLKRDEIVTAEELTEHRLALEQMTSIINEMKARLDLIEQRH